MQRENVVPQHKMTRQVNQVLIEMFGTLAAYSQSMDEEFGAGAHLARWQRRCADLRTRKQHSRPLKRRLSPKRWRRLAPPLGEGALVGLRQGVLP